MNKDSCRLCKSKSLYRFLDLGYHPHSDQFRNNIDEPEIWYPLRLNYCNDCGFVQLTNVVNPDVMYTKDYLYESSITSTASNHWSEFAETVSNDINLPLGETVVDIGSNDGTLLSKFKSIGYSVVGIDPCKEVADIANSRGIRTINGYFNDENMEKACPGKTVKLITGTNVFAHIDDLDSVMNTVCKYLSEDGVFVFESPYFGNFLEKYEYDTIYHQHLSYLSLKPLIPFFHKFGLEVYRVDKVDIHGGCFRVYINRIGNRPIQSSVKDMLDSEYWGVEELNHFSEKVKENGLELFRLISELYYSGNKIVAVSAPAKGNTLLNYTGIGRFLSFITDKSTLKQGRYTPGSHLKVMSDDLITEEKPDYGLLLAWNFSKEIISNNPSIKKWIIPIPSPTIVDSSKTSEE